MNPNEALRDALADAQARGDKLWERLYHTNLAFELAADSLEDDSPEGDKGIQTIREFIEATKELLTQTAP